MHGDYRLWHSLGFGSTSKWQVGCLDLSGKFKFERRTALTDATYCVLRDTSGQKRRIYATLLRADGVSFPGSDGATVEGRAGRRFWTNLIRSASNQIGRVAPLTKERRRSSDRGGTAVKAARRAGLVFPSTTRRCARDAPYTAKVSITPCIHHQTACKPSHQRLISSLFFFFVIADNTAHATFIAAQVVRFTPPEVAGEAVSLVGPGPHTTRRAA